jgi:hypothetical protein
MPQLAGSKALVEAIRGGEDPRRIAGGWQDSLKAFEAERQSVLLYR